jgi:DnaJ-class molecular chaperone
MQTRVQKTRLQLVVGSGRDRICQPAHAGAGDLVLCPRCKGDKKIKDENGNVVDCPRCNGTGLVIE